jgi:hypothetical protein
MTLVVTVKLAAAEPAGTEILAATLSKAVLLERRIDAPPEPAGPDRVTVHVALPLEPRLVGLHEIDFKVTDVTKEIDAVLEALLKVAVTTAV